MEKNQTTTLISPTPPPNEAVSDTFPQTLTGHLRELRRRFVAALICVTVTSIISYFFSESILNLILSPLQTVGEPVYFLSLPEAFLVRIKISFLTGLVVSSPFLLSQLWAFVAPGLKDHERRWAKWILLATACLFLIGALFSFFLIVPVAVKFLMSFGSYQLRPMISIGHYVSFVGGLVLACGILFELPAAMVALVQLGFLSTEKIRRWRKGIILGIVILAGALTPSPDATSQLLLAIPLYALFELCLLACRGLEARRREGLVKKTSF